MVKTVRDVCELNQIALNYAMSEQIENLSDVIDKTAQDAARHCP